MLSASSPSSPWATAAAAFACTRSAARRAPLVAVLKTEFGTAQKFLTARRRVINALAQGFPHHETVIWNTYTPPLPRGGGKTKKVDLYAATRRAQKALLRRASAQYWKLTAALFELPAAAARPKKRARVPAAPAVRVPAAPAAREADDAAPPKKRARVVAPPPTATNSRMLAPAPAATATATTAAAAAAADAAAAREDQLIERNLEKERIIISELERMRESTTPPRSPPVQHQAQPQAHPPPMIVSPTGAAFRDNESYKHRYAKNVLREWFSGGGTVGDVSFAPDRPCGVWFEYPVVTTAACNSVVRNWDEIARVAFAAAAPPVEYVPTFNECVAHKIYPKYVVDVVLPHAGRPHWFIEICHTHPTTPEKVAGLRRMGVTHLIEMDAEWIMRQTQPPTRLQYKRLI